MPTYYEILGVPPRATAEEIRKAFRQAARARHPDMAGDEAGMVQLNQAYETLRDPEQRRAYDRSLHGGVQLRRPPAPSVSVVDPLDFMVRVFQPIDWAIARTVKHLDRAVDELAYDVYDDHYVERFQAAVEQASEAVTEAVWALRRSRWPAKWDPALHLYSQGMRQIEDALEDFEQFPLNYDSDLVVLGRQILRGGTEIMDEARARMGVGG